jgi:preprotein translocase subunit Sss1
MRNRIRDFLVLLREPRKEGLSMLLLVLLAVLAIIAFGIGFTIHWLFIVAVVLALIWVIAMVTGGFGRTGARRW